MRLSSQWNRSLTAPIPHGFWALIFRRIPRRGLGEPRPSKLSREQQAMFFVVITAEAWLSVWKSCNSSNRWEDASSQSPATTLHVPCSSCFPLPCDWRLALAQATWRRTDFSSWTRGSESPRQGRHGKIEGGLQQAEKRKIGYDPQGPSFRNPFPPGRPSLFLCTASQQPPLYSRSAEDGVCSWVQLPWNPVLPGSPASVHQA